MQTIFQTNDITITHDWHILNKIATPMYTIKFKLNGKEFNIRNDPNNNTFDCSQKIEINDPCNDSNCWLHQVPHSHNAGHYLTTNTINVPDPTNIDINDYIPFKIDIEPIDISIKQIGIDCKIMVIPI